MKVVARKKAEHEPTNRSHKAVEEEDTRNRTEARKRCRQSAKPPRLLRRRHTPLNRFTIKLSQKPKLVT